jgi:signal transduction histidine kinase
MAQKTIEIKAPVVIVADDHQGIRHLIRSVLEKDGLIVIEAKNGKEALELFIKEKPDLVLLDIFMPVMDGLDTCTQIKKLPGGSLVPVLIFTAHGDIKNAEDAFKVGAADFINKPINPEELHHRVNRLLYLRAMEIEREAAELEILESHKKARLLSRKVLRAYEEEKVRLAREIHDDLGMALTAIKLNLQLIKKDCSNHGQGFEEKLTSLVKLADNTLAAMRDKAFSMRPPALDDLGLVMVLDEMAKEFSRNTGIRIERKTTGRYNSLPLEVETALYRCVQEALTNAARHSSAGQVDLNLYFSPSQVKVSVIDDGIGFDPVAGGIAAGHLGLKGIRERVALIDGEIDIKSSPGKGTTILITIPLNGGNKS